jgi:hypothetical protein
MSEQYVPLIIKMHVCASLKQRIYNFLLLLQNWFVEIMRTNLPAQIHPRQKIDILELGPRDSL